MRQPLARVAFGDFRLPREFLGRHRALLFEGLVEAELIAHAHHRHAERAAEIAQHLADEHVQLALVHHLCLLELLDSEARLPDSERQSNRRFGRQLA